MATLKNWFVAIPTLVSLSLFGWTLLGGCSSSSGNPTPTYSLDASTDGKKTTTPDGSSKKDGTTPKGDTGTGKDSSTPKDVVVVSKDTGTPTDGRLPADALVDVSIVDGHVVDSAVCATTDGGCYKCAPTTNLEFLNQCTTSTCSPFNDFQRLPNYDGGLPPLP
jgi:hypothetical protein